MKLRHEPPLHIRPLRAKVKITTNKPNTQTNTSKQKKFLCSLWTKCREQTFFQNYFQLNLTILKLMIFLHQKNRAWLSCFWLWCACELSFRIRGHWVHDLKWIKFGLSCIVYCVCVCVTWVCHHSKRSNSMFSFVSHKFRMRMIHNNKNFDSLGSIKNSYKLTSTCKFCK